MLRYHDPLIIFSVTTTSFICPNENLIKYKNPNLDVIEAFYRVLLFILYIRERTERAIH